MQYYVNSFYYLYNFFSLYKSANISSALLLYKKVDWNTSSIHNEGYALADEYKKSFEDEYYFSNNFKNISTIGTEEILNSVLIGLNNNSSVDKKFEQTGNFIKNILIDFRDSLIGLVEAELIPDKFELCNSKFDSVVKTLIIELIKRHLSKCNNPNAEGVVFYLLRKYNLGIFDFIFWIYEPENIENSASYFNIRNIIMHRPVILNNVKFKNISFDADEDGECSRIEEVSFIDKRLKFISIFEIIENNMFTDESTSVYQIEHSNSYYGVGFIGNRFDKKIFNIYDIIREEELSFIQGRMVFDEKFVDEYMYDIIKLVVSEDSLKKFIENIIEYIDESRIKGCFANSIWSLLDTPSSAGDSEIDRAGPYTHLILHPLFIYLKSIAIARIRRFKLNDYGE